MSDSLNVDKSRLKQKTVSSMVWNTIQRFGTMTISFLSNLVLARLLVPDDFGAIGMLTIFISLSEVFIDGGFGSALIQKKEVTQSDYSTIFYWNLIVAVLLFVVLCLGSPYVAEFYHMPILCDVLRATSLILIINGFSVIQTNILTKNLEFKLIAKINLISMTIGVAVAIVMAYMGFGVWSLVIKNLLASGITAILLWVLTKWRPSLIFSWTSFKSLFSFGSLLLVSRLLNSLFENIQGLVIGRYYSSKDLGFYSQAKRLDQLPSNSISQIITRVTFPVFSKISDNPDLLRNAVRKNVICTTYLLFPLQVLLIVIAQDLITFLFTVKWMESVPYFRVLCVYSMFITLNAINTNIYIAKGNSKLYFWVQLVKKIIGIFLLIIGVRYGVIGITWSLALSGIVWWIISASINSRFINYGLASQIKDVIGFFLIAVIIGVVIYHLSTILLLPTLGSLFVYSLLFVGFYFLFSKIFNLEPFGIYKNIVRNYFFKRRKVSA